MKISIPALLLLLSALPAQAYLSDEDYSDRIRDLEGFARYSHSQGVSHEGQRCLPNWDEKYAPTVKALQDVAADAARKASDAGGEQFAYRSARQPFIGAFAFKTTAYMCEKGYEHLLGEYSDDVKYYENVVGKLEDQVDRLDKAAADADSLFEKRSLKKDLAAGKCLFSTGMRNEALGFAGSIRKEATEVNDLVKHFRELVAGARGDRKTTTQERDEACDGSKVRGGALKAHGEWGNDRDPEEPAGQTSAR